MLGKPEWFQRRKYGGWGLTPKTWQGWAYTVVMFAPILLLQAFGASGETLFAVTLAWTLFVCFDVIDIMAKLKKDEREVHIEAIAERNSAWAMVAVVVIGLGYQTASSVVKNTLEVDPFLPAVILAGAVVKAATNWHLERRM